MRWRHGGRAPGVELGEGEGEGRAPVPGDVLHHLQGGGGGGAPHLPGGVAPADGGEPGQALEQLGVPRHRLGGLEEVEALEAAAEEEPGGALLRHAARAADVEVPQQGAVLADHRQGVVGAVAGEAGDHGRGRFGAR